MSATAFRPSRAGRALALPAIPAVVARALLVSRALVFGAGALASLAVPRFAGWRLFDPHLFSTGLGPVGDALTATAVRWDAIHYLQIARFGYRLPADTAFFPVYPLAIHLVAWLTGSAAGAGIAISLISFAIALTLLHRLTELELGGRAADATVLLLAFAPLSLFFSALYSESLFLALSVGALYAARRGRFVLACALAAVATITRVPGILVIVPVAMMARHRRAGGRAQVGAALLLAPAALVAFLGYLAARGFGWLAPVLQQTTIEHMHVLAGPFTSLGFATGAALDGVRSLVGGGPVFAAAGLGGPLSRGAQSLVLFAVLLVAVAALVLCFRRLPRPYAVYALLMLTASVFSPTLGQPLEGLDRYLLVVFPLAMVAGAWLSERRTAALAGAVGIGGALGCCYAFEIARWAFLG